MIARVRVCTKCKGMYWKNKKIKPEKVKDFDVVVENFFCKACEPKQFKALVQLRGFDELVIGDYGKSVKEVKKDKHGFDLQFASSGAANSYYKWMKKRFPDLEVKRSQSLVALKDGQRIHRPTICLRKT